MNPIIWEDMKMLQEREKDWNKLYGKSVLITGAYGMIASYAVFFLCFLNETCEAEITIYAMGRNQEKARQRFGEYWDKTYFHFFQSDLSDVDSWNITPDYIIHAASPASPQYYSLDPVGVIAPNVQGTFQLLQLAKDHPVEGFLFVSSGEVYGEAHADSIAEGEYGISDPLDIRYCYGESKRMGECLCKCFSYQYNVPTKIVRLGHTYGPTMHLDGDQRVFSEFVNNIVRNEDIVIKSDGSPMRAFCYLLDAVAGIYKVLLYGKNGEAYNIANINALISIKDLAESLVSIFPGKKLHVVYKKRSEEDSYMESKQTKHSVPNTMKLEELGWRCQIEIQEGFFRTVESITYEQKHQNIGGIAK